MTPRLLPRRLQPKSVAAPAVPRIDAGLVAKWLIPSVAGLFAVVGYIVQSAHSSLLGGSIVADEGAGYAAAAADFFYDLPTIAADLLLSCLTLSCMNPGQSPLGGHGLPLAIVAALASAAWWLPVLLRGHLSSWSPALAPVLLVVALACKFVWLDAPIARIENVVVAANEGDDARPGWRPPPAGEQAVDRLINARAEALWRHMACSRDPLPPVVGKATVSCAGIAHKDRRLTEGEFAARFLACALVALLAWKASRGAAPWRTVLALLGLATLLSLPHAYGKLLKPTIFAYGKVDLAKPLTDALAPVGSRPSPLAAIVLARRSAAVDLLVVGSGHCANDGPKYVVTKVWVVPNAQVLSIREIFRRDVIGWKLSNDQEGNCPDAKPPGSTTGNL